MFKNKSPGRQIKTGVLTCVISFILIVIDGFVGLGKGEADAHFNDSFAGHTVTILYVIFGILFLLGLIFIIAGVIRLVINRNRISTPTEAQTTSNVDNTVITSQIDPNNKSV